MTRNGYDFTDRYPLIVDAIRSIRAKSCIVDGEAIVVDKAGLSVFDLISHRRHDHAATICAFDLIEVDMHAPTAPRTGFSAAAPPRGRFCRTNASAQGFHFVFP